MEILQMSALVIVFIFGLIIGLFFKEIKPKKKQPAPKIDMEEADKILNYLNRLIKEKYNYYMYLELLPLYMENKVPENKVIDSIKKKIYATVVGGFPHAMKQNILKYFTEKGIEVYINERILFYINQTDFKLNPEENFKGIKSGNLEKFMP